MTKKTGRRESDRFFRRLSLSRNLLVKKPPFVVLQMGSASDYQVYVIENEAGRKYIGLSENVDKRLNDHNTGISKWTKTRGPWHLIWRSSPMDLSAALKLEKELKRQKGGIGLYKLTGLRPRSSGS